METETKLMALLTNEPSDWMPVQEKVEVQFRRPAFADKYRSKAWGLRKLKEYGCDPEDDNNVTNFITYWAHLNAFVSAIRDDGKPYTDKGDYDYLLERFLIEEVYEKGGFEESFIGLVMVQFASWVASAEVEESELKNS